MRNHARKRIRFSVLPAVLLIMLTFLMGCDKNFLPAGSEITSYEIIRVMGIDKGGDDGMVEVTLIAERAKPSPGEEGGGMSYEVMSEEGPTAFEAVSELRAKTDKRQVFGYIDYIIFGEDTAKEDITKYADYPARNPEIRYSPKVFIARGSSAKELLSGTSSGDKYIGDALDNLTKNVDTRSDFSVLRNIELMNMLDNTDIAAVIPALEAKEADNGKLIDGEKPEKRLTSAGYMVLRGFKFAGYFDPPEARAYNFLTGGVRSCVYSIKDDSGAFTGLDVLNGGLKITPHWSGDMLSGVTYTVQVNANILEQRSLEDLGAQKALRGLETRLEDAIEEQLRDVIAKSKVYGLDCFKLGGRIKLAHPYKWRKLESNWREIYKNLDIRVKAEAAVRRVYDIREPSGGGGGA